MVSIELAVGSIVRRVLKVIREVSRGELKTEGRDDRATVTPDDSSLDEETDNDNDVEEEPEKTKERPVLTTQTSMFTLLTDMSILTVKEKKREENEKRIRDTYHLKPLIIQEITEEIIADLDTVYKGIADQALDFIHAK